ncbi:FBF1 factor, partial [Menura novaehollandiae]|nr:FBF1 factor [Menura novaehollandiae]
RPRFPPAAPFPQRSAREQQDGERALREARSVQAQHRQRLQALQEQLEQLRQQEQPFSNGASPSLFPGAGQERLSLARQRKQLQEELSPGALGTLLGTLPVDGLGSTRAPLVAPGARGLLPGFLPPLGMILGGSGHPLGSAALYGNLLLLKHRARMDHDFLENERIFLESLKKGP